MFSGFDDKNASYAPDSWQYEGEVLPSPLAEHFVRTTDDLRGRRAPRLQAAPAAGRSDAAASERCVYQIMRHHFERYTPEMVERVTGCSAEHLPARVRGADAATRGASAPVPSATPSAGRITRMACRSSAPRPSSRACSAISGGPAAGCWHCAAIAASRAAPTSRRSTTCCRPTCRSRTRSCRTARCVSSSTVETVPTGWWHNLPKYMISLLKAWYGAHAQPENAFGYDSPPEVDRRPFAAADDAGDGGGRRQRPVVIGQNPVVGAVNSELVQRGLAKLDWLVVRDFAMTETANFWQKGSLVQRGELTPADIGTEVFFLPIRDGGRRRKAP